MPNWTENILHLKKKHWDKFKEVALDDEGEIDFEKLIPHPLEVEIDIFYNNILTNPILERDDAKDYEEFSEKWFEDRKGESVRLSHVFKELGMGDQGWYDWQCTNWGTKWNADTMSIPRKAERESLDDEDYLEVVFNTAWSDPQPWFEKLSEIIPFEVECIEEGGFFHLNCESDGKGNFTIDDDTAEYFANQDEDDEEE